MRVQIAIVLVAVSIAAATAKAGALRTGPATAQAIALRTAPATAKAVALRTTPATAKAVALRTPPATAEAGALQVNYPDPTVRVLTHREQNALVTPWIKKRFDTLLAGLMTREGIDMWIIPSREYNEDPVFASMSPLTYFASRRRTILVFYNPGGGKPAERYSIGRFDYDGIYPMVPTTNDGQHEGLRKLVDQKHPKVIGINVPTRGSTPTASRPTRSAGS